MLTIVEAARYLSDGTLPPDFRERVVNFLEFATCPNCDGRLCMDCVLRTIHDRCVADCPDCCEDGEPVVPPIYEGT